MEISHGDLDMGINSTSARDLTAACSKFVHGVSFWPKHRSVVSHPSDSNVVKIGTETVT